MADLAELSEPFQGTQKDGGVTDLSIIIVSWNVRDYLRSCLSSIIDNQGDLLVEVIVVDSGSADGSTQMIRDEYPSLKLVACNDNVGFPRGNNIGLRDATGRFLLLLNPDTEIISDALSQMVAYLEENEEVGVVGGQLLNSDGTVQSSRRRFPSIATAAFESTWLQPYAPREMIRQYYAEDLPLDDPVEVDWLVGACLMTRREVIDEVGLMDEAYFMYSEELDWCRRIREAGWRIVYLPEAQIIHHVGKSSEQAETERHVNFQRAKLRYFRKYHGRLPTALLRMILLLNYVWQLIIEVGKGLLGNRRSLRWQRARAYLQVLRSGLKPAGY
jgi:N-acetylglucosaminyl-diphospho-decaprenol L-rhamnosyltransferase